MPYATPDTTSNITRPPVGRIATALALYEAATKGIDQARTLYRRHFQFSVTVNDRDPIYADVHDWLLSVVPNERHRSLFVTSERGARAGDHESITPDGETSGDYEPQTPLRVMFNDTRTRRVTVNGHTVSVKVEHPESGPPGSLTAGKAIIGEQDPTKIIFTTASYTAQQAVLDLLAGIHAAQRKVRRPVLKMVTSWGSWRTRNDLPPRTLDSVALPAAQKHRIVADLRDFIAAEDRYNRLAIPWHRGYMFHGPPGTGKTSLVKALAHEFNLDLWYISLSSLTEESSLMSLLADVGPRSLLLLEDIDTVQITHDRDTQTEGTQAGRLSLSSLLNALDGVATPHGLITVMTTNHFDRLDPAMTRAGRMDVVEELGYPTGTTVGALYEHFYEQPFPGALPDRVIEVAPASLAETMKRHMDDPAAAAEALRKLLGLHAPTRPRSRHMSPSGWGSEA